MHKHVLIIDDDPINNLICEKVLERADFAEKVSSFLSAVDALDWLLTEATAGRGAVDVIFLDINLPLMDGWDFLEQLQQRRPDFRALIFILSSSVSLEDQQKAIEHPLIHSFILKPLTLEKLAELNGASV